MHTVFIGGGTPTLLRPDLWKTLLQTLGSGRDGLGWVSQDRQAPNSNPNGSNADVWTEFTVEANPETVTGELLQILLEGGVNRLSIGCQTFNPVHLKTLERWHDPANVARSVEMARKVGIGNINLDLIFGIPGQTVDEWRADLEHALALQPTHLSCYGLTYEPATALTAKLKAGQIRAIDEDIEAEMFELTYALLDANGFEAYEISNFARRSNLEGGRPDTPWGSHQCQHNLVYWRNGQWAAAGPGAAGHVGKVRWKNRAHLTQYLESPTDWPPIQDFEEADMRTQLAEELMMGLRLLKEGVDAGAVLEQARTIGKAEALLRQVEGFVQRGLMRIEDDGDGESGGARWIVNSPEGAIVSNDIIVKMMAALDD